MMKPVLLKLHRWIGIAICVWAAAVALSGTILAFRAQLEAAMDPGAYLTQTKTERPDFDRMVRSLAETYPDRQILVFYRNGLRDDEAMRVNLTRRSTPGDPVNIQDPSFNAIFDADLEVTVNPATGEILSQRPFLNWWRIIYDFHTTLLTPVNGKSYMGVLGFFLAFLAGSGLIYWWPRAGRFWKSFAIATDRGQRRFLKDIHALGGAVVAVLLLLSTISGIMMCFEGQILGALRSWGLAAVTIAAPRPPAPADTPFISVQQAADSGTRAYPDTNVVLLYPPSAGRGRYLLQLFPKHASRIWWTVEANMDATDGKILSAFDPRKQPATNSAVLWIIFFHNGQMFGVPGRIMVMTEGLVLLMLCVTGPWIWLLRRAARIRRQARDPGNAGRFGAAAGPLTSGIDGAR